MLTFRVLYLTPLLVSTRRDVMSNVLQTVPLRQHVRKSVDIDLGMLVG